MSRAHWGVKSACCSLRETEDEGNSPGKLSTWSRLKKCLSPSRSINLGTYQREKVSISGPTALEGH